MRKLHVPRCAAISKFALYLANVHSAYLPEALMQRSKRRFLFPLCLQLLSYSAYFTRCKPRFYADVDSTLCPKTASNCRTRVRRFGSFPGRKPSGWACHRRASPVAASRHLPTRARRLCDSPLWRTLGLQGCSVSQDSWPRGKRCSGLEIFEFQEGIFSFVIPKAVTASPCNDRR